MAIVDGDRLSRHAVRTRLAAETDIRLVGEAGDAATGIELVREWRPDVVLIELALPDRSGTDAMRDILTISPETRVVILAADADDTTALRALRDGATGFLLKSIDLDALPRVLRGVQAGEAAVSRALAMRLVEDIHAREG